VQQNLAAFGIFGHRGTKKSIPACPDNNCATGTEREPLSELFLRGRITLFSRQLGQLNHGRQFDHGGIVLEGLHRFRAAIPGLTLDLVDEVQGFQKSQCYPTEIYLEPALTDACRIRMCMVVIVPALAIGD
jgi:hypothetical protein